MIDCKGLNEISCALRLLLMPAHSSPFHDGHLVMPLRTDRGVLVSKEGEDIEKIIFSQPLSIIIPKLSHSRRLERAWQLIEKQYDSPNLSLEEAARISGLNKNHLNTLFRQATNFTFHQFLIRYRILGAIAMMEMKNYSLLEIAMENGFGSLTTFERNFRGLMGKTPKEFRKIWISDE